MDIRVIICTLLTWTYIVLIGWIILSYVVAFGRLPWGYPVRKVYDFINRALQPILAPIRAILPPLRMGGAALDLSPLVLFFGIFLLQSFLCRGV